MKKVILVLLVLFTGLSPASAMETTFSPRATVSEEYTDNLNLTPDNEEEDFITTAGVGASLGFRGSTAGLSLAYNPEHVTYRDNSDLDTWRHYGSMDAYWQVARQTRLRLNDSLIISDDPVDEIDISTEARGRNKFTRNTAHADITHQFGREDSFAVGYDHSLLMNKLDQIEDSQSERPYADMVWWFMENQYGFQVHVDHTRSVFERSDNFRSWFGDFRLRKRFTRHFDMFVMYDHMITVYDKDPYAVDFAEVEDYQVYNPGMGFNYVAGEHTNISMAAGYVIREREFSESDKGPMLTSLVTTAWPFRRGSVTLEASSGYTQDTFSATNRGFNMFGGAGCRAEYGFTSRLQGDVVAHYRYVRYLDEDPTIENHIVSAGPGLSYQALRWMRLRLEYTYRKLFSDEAAEEYTENRAMVSMTLEPSSPLRWN